MIADYVTRSGADLLLNANGYRVQKLDRGAVTHDNETVGSRYINGAVLTATHKTLSSFRLDIVTSATSASQLWALIDALTDAFEQPVFEYHRVRNGRDVTWECMAADYTIGDSYVHEAHLCVSTRFIVPRQPFETVEEES